MTTHAASLMIKNLVNGFSSHQNRIGPTCVWLGAQAVAKTAKFGLYFFATGVAWTAKNAYFKQPVQVQLAISCMILLVSLAAKFAEKKALEILALQRAVSMLPTMAQDKTIPTILAQAQILYDGCLAMFQDKSKLTAWSIGFRNLEKATGLLATACAICCLHDILNLQWVATTKEIVEDPDAVEGVKHFIKHSADVGSHVFEAAFFLDQQREQIKALFQKAAGHERLLGENEKPLNVTIFDKLIAPFSIPAQ